MVLTLIHLLQAQAAKVSWLLWAAAILFFLAGLALLIYLMTRAKTADQLDELEDDGGGLLSGKKLLDEIEEPKEQDATLAPDAALSAKEENANAGQTMPLFSEADFRKSADHKAAITSSPAASAEPEIPPAPVTTEPLAEDRLPQSVQVSSEPEAEPIVTTSAVQEHRLPDIPEERETVETPAVSQPSVEPTPVVEERGTQVLSSQQAPTVEQNTLPLVAQEASSGVQEETLFSPQEEALLAQENSSARVDAPASQQRFEPTATFKREPFEPPTIEPLTPKPAATERLASPANLSATTESGDAKTTALTSQPSRTSPVTSSVEEVPQIPAPDDSKALPVSPASTPFTATPQTQEQAAALWEAQGAGTRSVKGKPAGTVLGIPAETSHAPLVLGEPRRAKEDEGVEALLNYDKDLNAAETGRGGAIALLLVIVLIAGAVLAYFFVPAVRSRADVLIARLRGQQTSAPPVVEKPKAQIYPSRNPEVVKNMVKARGAVTNISEEALEDLSVEVSLDRGEGTTAETRVIVVNPSALAPRQQGLYEFEYEGSKATGFSRYRVTKLLSRNGEVKFTAPNQ